MHRNHLEYPQKTMFEMVSEMAVQHPKEPAYQIYGKKTSYQQFVTQIEGAAKGLAALGIRRDDRVTICMPNCPPAVDAFYAVNRIGAAANMVHPLSAKNEIIFYLNVSKSKAIITLDLFYDKVKEAVMQADHPVIVIVARMHKALPFPVSAAFFAKEGRKHILAPDRPQDLRWDTFIQKGRTQELPPIKYEKDHTAVILYSGGTTGVPKGICLTDLNFNALSLQAVEHIEQPFHYGLSMLSCMPMFHGFGLGINFHTVLSHGACCILMPTFNAKTYADMLIKTRPNFIAGVPTIFEALLHMPQLDGKDLSFLKGMFCGGDSLSVELKKKIDTFLKEHHAEIQVREGYGLTECVTASCLTPKDEYRPGSIGLPFPDTVYAIVKPGTDEVVPVNTEGEIILKGPTLMKGYLDNPEETAQTLRVLADGDTWLYTGDLGRMDEDGYIYFSQRIKRMIITNGYNVYPGQLENVIDSVPGVSYSCVIGVKDPRRMQRVRAYVVPRDGVEGDIVLQEQIMEELRAHIAAYALPKEIIFRKELPKTLVGKVAYRALEEEANAETANE